MKKYLIILTILITVSFKSNAQYISWYQLDNQHPAFQLAQSWAGGYGNDYIRGFCFGWDALGGHSVTYGSGPTVQVGGPTYGYYIHLGDGISSFLASLYLSATYFYEAAYLLETNYLPTLTDPSQITFYRGYINLLYQVSYSPGILEINPNNQN